MLLREPGRRDGRVKRGMMGDHSRLRAESIDEPGCCSWEGDLSEILARRSRRFSCFRPKPGHAARMAEHSFTPTTAPTDRQVEAFQRPGGEAQVIPVERHGADSNELGSRTRISAAGQG